MSESCEHPVEQLETSVGVAFKRLLLDWRLWAIAFGFGLLGGALSSSRPLARRPSRCWRCSS